MGVNNETIISAYIPGGNPDKMNVIIPAAGTPGVYVPYVPGDQGNSFPYLNRLYTQVKLDAAATAVTAGMVLYWMDKKRGIVTNVVANAINGGVANAWRNEIAGIARVAIAVPSTINGNLICMLVKGTGVTVKATAGAVGDILISDVSGSVGSAVNIAVGTAPTYKTIGVVTTAVSAGVVIADVNIDTVN